jgi:hypothetical protein
MVLTVSRDTGQQGTRGKNPLFLRKPRGNKEDGDECRRTGKTLYMAALSGAVYRYIQENLCLMKRKVRHPEVYGHHGEMDSTLIMVLCHSGLSGIFIQGFSEGFRTSRNDKAGIWYQLLIRDFRESESDDRGLLAK